MKTYTTQTSVLAHTLFHDTRTAPFWLLVRLYVGYEWLMAGWEKLGSTAWFGADAGAALTGFVNGAVTKTGGLHPDVTGWYASFLQGVVLPNVWLWSHLVTLGELAVGLGLIVGLFTGVAAFFGGFMNLNFLLAGTVSTNPILFVLSLGLVLARRAAGRFGLDHYLPTLRRNLR